MFGEIITLLLEHFTRFNPFELSSKNFLVLVSSLVSVIIPCLFHMKYHNCDCLLIWNNTMRRPVEFNELLPKYICPNKVTKKEQISNLDDYKRCSILLPLISMHKIVLCLENTEFLKKITNLILNWLQASYILVQSSARFCVEEE